MDENMLDTIKSMPNVLSQLYDDLAKPSVVAVGKALGTVFEFSTSFLLPVKFLNEKFKINFKKRIDEYSKKLEKVPLEKRCEVDAQLGVPIIEKLSYTTNDEIADLFTTLLVNASNVDMVNTAHPAFIDIISRLSKDEARIIKYLKDKSVIQYCDIIGDVLEGEGYYTLIEHATLLSKEIDFDFPGNINAYFANLSSMGILYDMAGTSIVDQTVYDRIKQEYDIEELKSQFVPERYKNIGTDDSYYQVTNFGELFINSCVR